MLWSCLYQRAWEIKSTVELFWFCFVSVVGNDGFYIILKGSARPQTKVHRNLTEENESTASFIPQSFQEFVNEDFKNFILAEMHTPSCDATVRNESLLFP